MRSQGGCILALLISGLCLFSIGCLVYTGIDTDGTTYSGPELQIVDDDIMPNITNFTSKLLGDLPE